MVGGVGNAPDRLESDPRYVVNTHNVEWCVIVVTVAGGMDEFSWTFGSDHVIRHKQQELYKVNISNGTVVPSLNGDVETTSTTVQEGDVIGVSYDHIQLKFYVNGSEIDYAVTNIKGTVYPVLYGILSSV